MAEIHQVTVSGAVGKQVFPTSGNGSQRILQHVIVDAPVSASTLTIRDGHASGDVRLTMSIPAGNTYDVPTYCKRFDRGMHVKVTGATSKAYLVIK